MTHNYMTNNEKAATFVGWKISCLTHGNFPNCKPHCIDRVHSVAPDMADPHNYMRALESCDRWYKDYKGEWEAKIDNLCGVGQTPVEVLADLYDTIYVRCPNESTRMRR